MLNRRPVRSGVIEIMDIYDMTSVYQWHRPHLWATGVGRPRGWGSFGALGAWLENIFRWDWVGWGGGGTETIKGVEVLLFLFAPQRRHVCPLAFLSLCQNYFWLEKESVYSVAWFAGVTPCSHQANPLFPIQNGLHIFPVTQGLKRMRGKSRGWVGGWLEGRRCYYYWIYMQSAALPVYAACLETTQRILSRNCRCSRGPANSSWGPHLNTVENRTG